MSFIRINPTNWAFGSSYTSTQANAQDVYWPSVLDKTGDTITGTVGVSNTGQVSFNSGSILNIASGATARSATGFYVSAGTIEIASGASLQADAGSTVALNIGASGFLSGNSSFQFIRFPDATHYETTASGVGQTRTIFQPFTVASALGNVASGFTASPGPVYGFPYGAGNGATSFIILPLDMMHDKAVLTGVSIVMAVSPSNPNSGPPSSLPKINILRYTCDGSGTQSSNFGSQTLTNGVQDLPVDYAAAGGNQQTPIVNGLTSPYTTINRAVYRYYMTLQDDNSTYVGNIYFGALLTFGSINSLTFP